MRVYNFTKEEHAISNILNKRIKVSLLEDLNDPFELLAIDMGDKNQRKVFNKFKRYFNSKAGIVCFTDNWQNSVMWSHYANKHKGVCLGFDIDEKILKKVKYLKYRKKYELSDPKYSHGISANVLSELCRYKFVDWKYENEYRGIIPLKEKDKSGHYFVDFSDEFVLREIIIGSACKLKPINLKEYLQGYSQRITVIKSRLAFRDFKVVKNKLEKIYVHA